MNTYRYNPVFNQWVLLGAPTNTQLEITERHLLDVGRQKDFAAVTMPRNPFIMEPSSKVTKEDDLLYEPQQPVGEAEVLLYTGEVDFLIWQARQWQEWLVLLQHRIKQVYTNPYLHFVQFTFATHLLETAGKEYQRVGDLVATSHPIAGTPVPLQEELVQKLRQKEGAFIVLSTDAGDVYVPSAPLHEKEVWFLPKTARAAFDMIDEQERTEIAPVLTALFHGLHKEFPKTTWTLTLHTSLAGMGDESTWWFQIHEIERQTMSSYPVRPLPEAFARHLEYAINHR